LNRPQMSGEMKNIIAFFLLFFIPWQLQADYLTYYHEIFVDEDLGLIEVNTRLTSGEKTAALMETKVDEYLKKNIFLHLHYEAHKNKNLIREIKFQGKSFHFKVESPKTWLKVNGQKKISVNYGKSSPIAILKIHPVVNRVELVGSGDEILNFQYRLTNSPEQLDLNVPGK